MSTSERVFPSWLKQKLPHSHNIPALRDLFRDFNIHTVCQSARCPNINRCWSEGVATFMILGDRCTRACRFCAVSSKAPQAPDKDEPQRVAQSIKKLGLQYAVVTSVTRDDLEDYGAGQFLATLKAIQEISPGTKTEVLIPDFKGKRHLLKQIAESGADVVAHNIETIKGLYKAIRPQADYQRSLNVLKTLKEIAPQMITKSGFMVGLGENDDEIDGLLKDLKDSRCDILTIGQYLAPSKSARHMPVVRFVEPVTFEAYRQRALALGFRCVLSGPLVRSSFIAESVYQLYVRRSCASDTQKTVSHESKNKERAVLSV